MAKIVRQDFIEKWRNFSLKKEPVKKKGSDIFYALKKIKDRQSGMDIQGNMIISEVCVKCGERKERTTDNFIPNCDNTSDWFDKSQPGYEWLHNSQTIPCRLCLVVQNRKRIIEDHIVYQMTIVAKYPQLLKRLPDGKSDRGRTWILENLEGRCYVTGAKFPFAMIKGHPLCMSPNSLVKAERGEYDRKLNHEPHNTKGCLSFANCVQHGIPCLRSAYTELYTMVCKYYEMSEFERSEEQQAVWSLLKSGRGTIISAISSNSKLKDMRRNLPTLDGDTVVHSTAQMLQQFESSENVRCHTTRVCMDFHSRSWRSVHADRIDNGYSHSSRNLEMKCYLFANAKRLSRRQFMYLFLNQSLVQLSGEVISNALVDYHNEPEDMNDAFDYKFY